MKPSIASALRIAGAYLGIAAAWILISDRVLLMLVGDPAVAQQLQTFKGWFFVLVSATVLMLFTRIQFERRDRLAHALVEERESFRLLVEGVTDYAICMLDANGRVTTWNAGAETIAGWTAGDIIGQHFHCLYTPEDIAAGAPEKALREAAEKGRYAVEGQRVRRDGVRFWANVRISALRGADGSLRGFAKVTRDISAQKRAEAALLESERLFRAIFEQAAVGIVQIAPDGRILRANAHLCGLLGRNEHELLRSPLASFTHPDDIAAEQALGHRCLVGEIERYRLEKRFLRPDGRTVWAQVGVTLLRDHAGNPAFFAGIIQDVSARKAAEEALAANATQYRMLFAANPLPMFLYDLETLQIVAVNESAISSYGYTREEFLAMTVCDIRPPEDIPRLLEAVASVRSGRVRTPIERPGLWRHRRRDGTIIYVEISSHVVDFEGRKVDLVLANNVTARLSAEEALEESRARLSGIIESAMDAIITTDVHQRVVLFNRAAESMFRVPASRMLGQAIDTLLPEARRAAHRQKVQDFMRTGETSRRMGLPGQVAGRRADGEEFPAEASISHVVTPSGSFLTVILRDVTERTRADEALAESRRRLQVAIESAHLGFWDWDLGDNRIFFSPEWRRHLGLDQERVPADTAAHLERMHPEDRPLFEQACHDLIDGSRESADLEFRLLHDDGSYRDLRCSMGLMHDGAGRPTRVIGTNLDLTPIRDAERTVRRLSAHVLRLQDVERRRIARELHDTTAQNLAALNMNLGRLGRACDPADTHLSGLIEDSVALADLCVQEIRTLSYLLHPPLLDEFGLARAVEDYVAGFSARSGIQVDVHIEGATERLGDEVELSLFRVLQESLGNVHRHSGSLTAAVRLSQTEDSIELEVADDGHGIPPDQLERLHNRAALGVGVSGMAERIEQLGGHLEIDSGRGGTVVRAHIPR